MSVRFTQSCPTCGRRIQIRASLIGCTVACQHCHAEFVAKSSDSASVATEDVQRIEPADPLMARVEQALQRAKDPSTAVS